MNRNEHAMVRHEAAEALGAVGTFTDKTNDKNKADVLTLLEQLEHDDPHRVVRESAAVALDIAKYWMDDEFQYADGLQSSE
jgi:HEAT repeat protein